MTQFKRIEIEK